MTTAAPLLNVDLAPGLEGCFFFDAVEGSYEIPGIAGHLPDWLKGAWYVNGPGRFERSGVRYKHWLDGDGIVSALHLARDGIRFTSRFVQTRKLAQEEAAGRFLYRAFGTALPEGRLRRNVMIEPPVNVSVGRFGHRLLAFGEQTLPHEMDSSTLETIGEFDFGGKLTEVTPFAAHAKVSRGLLNFGVSFSPTHPVLNVYEFGVEGHGSRRRYPLRFPHSIHDFGYTPSHAVFFLSPLLMDFERFWGDQASVVDSLRWQPELGSRIFVAPRGNADAPFAVEVGEGYCLHVINCFESGARLTVDVLLLDAPVYREYQPVPDLYRTVPRCRPVRYLIDLETQQLLESSAMSYDLAPDFPAVNPARAGYSYSDFWMLGISGRGQPGRKFFNQLAHGSWEKGGVQDVYQALPGEYLGGEPSFISNPRDTAEAVVVCELLKPLDQMSSILIFDAFHVQSGPIAIIPLRFPVHPGFHTCFVPEDQTAARPRGELT